MTHGFAGVAHRLRLWLFSDPLRRLLPSRNCSRGRTPHFEMIARKGAQERTLPLGLGIVGHPLVAATERPSHFGDDAQQLLSRPYAPFAPPFAFRVSVNNRETTAPMKDTVLVTKPVAFYRRVIRERLMSTLSRSK